MTQPVSKADVVGAVKFQVNINGIFATCIIDTESGISVVSRAFVAKDRFPTVLWRASVAAVADVCVLDITEACVLEVAVLGISMKGIW